MFGVFYICFVDNHVIKIETKDKPILLQIIAALFFSISIYILGLYIYRFEYISYENFAKNIAALLHVIPLLIFGGISFSGKRTMYFDLENKKFKNELSVGPIKNGIWQDLPTLHYISVFGVDSKYFFFINLWYGKNEYLEIFTVYKKESAFELGYQIAKKLNVKLLDATQKNNYKYLDMDKLKEKYK